MRAAAAAAAAGVSVKALRYYEGLGLLVPRRSANGYRDYTANDVRLAAQVRELLDLGLSATQARPFLECLRAGHAAGDDCPESLAAYQARVDQLDALIGQLTRAREQVASRLSAAARRGFRVGEDHHEHDAREEAPRMHTFPLPAPEPLPPDLASPADDVAGNHLPGLRLPPLEFMTTDGERVRLNDVASGRWVLYVYPLTGDPAVDVPRGWDAIPGARGCSQEACSFRDNLAALKAAGVDRVLALSSDRAEYQADLVARMQLPYPMLSDPELSLARAMDLPTFSVSGLDGIVQMMGWVQGNDTRQLELYKRLTLIADADRIAHVFYPVFPPQEHAEQVLDWLQQHPPHAV